MMENKLFQDVRIATIGLLIIIFSALDAVFTADYVSRVGLEFEINPITKLIISSTSIETWIFLELIVSIIGYWIVARLYFVNNSRDASKVFISILFWYKFVLIFYPIMMFFVTGILIGGILAIFVYKALSFREFYNWATFASDVHLLFIEIQLKIKDTKIYKRFISKFYNTLKSEVNDLLSNYLKKRTFLSLFLIAFSTLFVVALALQSLEALQSFLGYENLSYTLRSYAYGSPIQITLFISAIIVGAITTAITVYISGKIFEMASQSNSGKNSFTTKLTNNSY